MAKPLKTIPIDTKPIIKGLKIFGLILLAIIIVSAGVKKINTGQVGVVTNFGRVTGRELSEGISVIIPFVEQVTRYDIKIQKEQQEAGAATNDLQDVFGEVVINYHLNRGQISNIHQTIGINYKDKIVMPALQETFKASAAKYNAGELITKRGDLKADVYKQLGDRLEKYGIVIDDVSITNFQFSPSFSKAIEEKQVAQQNAERAKFNLDASKTDSQAQQLQSETLSSGYLQKMAIEKWDGKMPQYMGGGSVFNIPLK